jgi:hypothetical protein
LAARIFHDARASDHAGLDRTQRSKSRQPVPAGTFLATTTYQAGLHIACMEEDTMDGLIYLVGLIVIILAILSFFGLR